MDTISIREIRQDWPRVERRLRSASIGLLITRDGTPVARLTLPQASDVPTTPIAFSPDQHRAWRLKRWKSKAPKATSDRWLEAERHDRRPGPDA